MKSKVKFSILICFAMLLSGCEQNIALKKSKMTGINPLSFTDVVYKSDSDTVLVSRFDGTISEMINKGDRISERLLLDVEDEIYSLGYDPRSGLIFASTLESGILIIDESTAEVLKILPIADSWSANVQYNAKLGWLAAYDYTKMAYLWNVADDFSEIELPQEVAGMYPAVLTDRGLIYFDGAGSVVVWDSRERNKVAQTSFRGRITDLDASGKILGILYDKWIFQNPGSDSVLMESKHPDWPIYVPDRDTTVFVPVSLPLTDAIISGKSIYSSGVDKSIRKWDAVSGELMENMLGHEATISALTVSNDGSQLTSVDLKGGIRFWELAVD